MQEGQNEPDALLCQGLPCRCYTVKFKLCGSYILNLTIDKLNTAIYVSYETEKFLEISKLKLDRSKSHFCKINQTRSCKINQTRSIYILGRSIHPVELW